MADSETTASRSTFGWLPKLILWAVVIAFGYLYLNSIDQEEGGSSTSLLEKIAQLSPIPISALPGSASKSDPAAESQVMASPAQQSPAAEYPVSKAPETPKAQESRPVNEAESAVFARSLMNEAPATAPAAVQRQTVEQPRVPAFDRRMTNDAVAPSMPESAQSAAPPAWAVPPMMAPEESTPPVRQAPYDWESMARQQARMQAEYAAMRREADERMRQYWEGMSAPAAGPYGYPGYPAGYGPGAVAPQR
ncbi:hypothetical protein [Thiocystis violascens]|uniref:Uncharacterized protein n=1 Tax=Thiocystis violascens (strain ATCC 17096 / DSM 198 / 6111) TaxID=765911 RepID=I3YDH4_THIV6|nr:hypothetical protein [Thiocystis violascens]AFL75042.1 hypothetical protein Thivi_3165 [Thiocystis violascens DSM 198]